MRFRIIIILCFFMSHYVSVKCQYYWVVTNNSDNTIIGFSSDPISNNPTEWPYNNCPNYGFFSINYTIQNNNSYYFPYDSFPSLIRCLNNNYETYNYETCKKAIVPTGRYNYNGFLYKLYRRMQLMYSTLYSIVKPFDVINFSFQNMYNTQDFSEKIIVEISCQHTIIIKNEYTVSSFSFRMADLIPEEKINDYFGKDFEISIYYKIFPPNTNTYGSYAVSDIIIRSFTFVGHNIQQIYSHNSCGSLVIDSIQTETGKIQQLNKVLITILPPNDTFPINQGMANGEIDLRGCNSFRIKTTIANYKDTVSTIQHNDYHSYDFLIDNIKNSCPLPQHNGSARITISNGAKPYMVSVYKVIENIYSYNAKPQNYVDSFYIPENSINYLEYRFYGLTNPFNTNFTVIYNTPQI